MNNPTSDQNDIIIETKIKSTENPCSDIGSVKRWRRKCPSCNNEQLYSTKYSLNYATFNDVLCRKCASKIRGNSHHTKENFVNKKFSKLTIIKQYIGTNNKTMVDCLCDCGKTKTTTLWNVKLGRAGSCGCQRTETMQFTNSQWKRKEYGWSAFMQVYNGYKGNAKHRKEGPREFKLSKEEAMKLFKGNCFYCGKRPSTIRKSDKYYGEFVYNGIDRKDNTKGYVLDNCVSCCSFCNMTKLDTPFEEFIGWIRNVNEHTKHLDINRIPC